MRKNFTHDNIFTDENAVSFYLLGAYMTDGNIEIDKKGYHRISITSIDRDWIDQIQKLVVPSGKVYQDKKRNCFTLKFRSETIKNWLISYGCGPNKSKTLCLEKEIPSQYRYDFIRGVNDGDGCISVSHITKQLKYNTKTYKRIGLYITCGSYKFATQLKELIDSDCSCSIYQKDRKEIFVKKNGRTIKPTTYWYVQAEGTKAIKILDKIYYTNHPISLLRKKKIFRSF